VKAVRLRNGREHWVYDVHLTLCGRRIIDLPVVAELDLAELSADGCATCLALEGAAGFEPFAPSRITSPAQPGRLRTTGHLMHGPRGRTARRLG